MTFDSIQKIKAAITNRYQVFVPMALVSSLLLVGYAALDKEAPVIKTDVIALNYGEELDYGKIQIEDNQTSYEDLTIEYDTSSLNINSVGSSYLTVQASDTSNNVTTKIVEVMVVDHEKPVYEIADNGNCKMEDGVLVINLNASNNITDYIVATDNADGDLTAFINVTGELDTTVVSRNAISLSVTDNSGNTNEKTFDVEVRDITAPTMSYIYGEAIEVPYGCEIDLSKYIEVSDNSGSLAVFDPTVPFDTTLAQETYTIVASDAAGNAVSLPLTIVTKDIMGPTINCESSYTITQGQSFDMASKVTAVDDKDGSVQANISGSIDTSKAGNYTFTITATDSSGNTSTKTVTVTVKSSNSGIVATAKSKVGCAYQYGATGPNAFDCSGFTQWVYKQNGKSIPRTTYSQYAAGTKISYSQIQPGDLIFWNCHGATNSHVSIYIGNGMIVHAATVKSGVCYTSVANMLSSATMYGCVRY